MAKKKPTPIDDMKAQQEGQRRLAPLKVATLAKVRQEDKAGFADLARKRAIARADRDGAATG